MRTTYTNNTRWRLTATLFLAQSSYSAAVIAAFTLTPIIAKNLSSAVNAGVPNTIGLVGKAAAAYPIGWLLARLGRRYTLGLGYGVACLGALLSAWGVIQESYWLFIVGATALGMSRAGADQTRYVGAEIFPKVRRALVIGILVFAGTIGAVAGPRLVPPSQAWLAAQGLDGFAGPFVATAILMAFSAFLMFAFLHPDPQLLSRQMDIDEQDDTIPILPPRSPREILRLPAAKLAVLAMAVGYLVMAMIMVITPVQMDAQAHDTEAIANVIMAHTLGMFGLAVLSGWIIDRIGRINMILVGALTLVAACLIAPLATDVPLLALALFLLGLGWNFCYVAGSSLFADCLRPNERGKSQGFSETIVAMATGAGSLSVGYLFATGGYLLPALVGLGFAVALIVAVFALMPPWRQIAGESAISP